MNCPLKNQALKKMISTFNRSHFLISTDNDYNYNPPLMLSSKDSISALSKQLLLRDIDYLIPIFLTRFWNSGCV